MSFLVLVMNTSFFDKLFELLFGPRQSSADGVGRDAENVADFGVRFVFEVVESDNLLVF